MKCKSDHFLIHFYFNLIPSQKFVNLRLVNIRASQLNNKFGFSFAVIKGVWKNLEGGKKKPKQPNNNYENVNTPFEGGLVKINCIIYDYLFSSFKLL